MATPRRIIDTRSLANIPRALERYRQAVNRESYKGLKEVAKSSVDVLQAAVRAAPPTRYPSRPTEPVRGSRSKLPAMPLVNNGAIASGRYLNSWKAKRMTLGGVMGVLIYNTQTHAPIVEYGRRAGRMPPVQAIRQWLQKKFSLPYRQARKLAFPVARSIQRRPIPGRKILTADRTAEMLHFYLEEQVAKAIQRSVRLVFR